METEQPRVAEALDGIMVEKAARYWWAPLVSGVVWLLIAWVVLRMDVRSLATVGVLIGVVFLLAAFNEAALGLTVTGGWRYLHYGIAAAFVLAAVWAFVRPINTFFALASVLGLILIFEGVFEIARAIASKEENDFWWLGLIAGLLLLLLAFWVSSSDREFSLGRRAALILFWVGFMALFKGISQIGIAFGLRRLGRTPRTTPGSVAADQVPPPSIPAQNTRASQPAPAEGARMA
jgi:uncharacterized membrane protein HdeD (DUF308 family)